MYTPDTVQMCYNDDINLYHINPRGPLQGQSTAQGAVSQALCVYKTNYAIPV